MIDNVYKYNELIQTMVRELSKIYSDGTNVYNHLKDGSWEEISAERIGRLDHVVYMTYEDQGNCARELKVAKRRGKINSKSDLINFVNNSVVSKPNGSGGILVMIYDKKGIPTIKSSRMIINIDTPQNIPGNTVLDSDLNVTDFNKNYRDGDSSSEDTSFELGPQNSSANLQL